jgi:hypothetical protein
MRGLAYARDDSLSKPMELIASNRAFAKARFESEVRGRCHRVYLPISEPMIIAKVHRLRYGAAKPTLVTSGSGSAR